MDSETPLVMHSWSGPCDIFWNSLELTSTLFGPEAGVLSSLRWLLVIYLFQFQLL